MREFHRQLFRDSADTLRQEIKRIAGVEVREASAEVEPTDGHRGAGVYDRHDGASVPAGPRSAGQQLEREWVGRIVHENGGSTMLILSRKNQESVVIGGVDGFHRLLKVTVIDITGGRVRLGFEVDPEVPVHRPEVWERIEAEGRKGPDRTPASPRGPLPQWATSEVHCIIRKPAGTT